jgi:hypothetical protein
MSKHSKDKRFSFVDERTRVALWLCWQALRRNPWYGRAVRVCLQDIQDLRASLLDRQRALGPRPSPPDGFAWLEVYRGELADLLIDGIYDRVNAMSPGERLTWGSQARAYRVRRQQWEKIVMISAPA